MEGTCDRNDRPGWITGETARFRNSDRRIAYADLLQEGVRGLLEAIDRFDVSHDTKLATYATWWIRQAVHRAVASGAYPVRLSPRHLRQLAQHPEPLQPDREPMDAEPRAARRGEQASELIEHIRAATRPTISLDAPLDRGTNFHLIDTISLPQRSNAHAEECDEAIRCLFEPLRPRERQVLALRFGLGGRERLSLSQVGEVLDVSRERVRPIQDRALEKLRATALEQHLDDLVEQKE